MSKIYTLQGELRPLLTRYARGYKNPSSQSEQLFPPAWSDLEETKIPIFGEDEFEEEDTERAIGADSNEWDPKDTTDVPITLVEHDLEAKVDYRKKKAAFYNYERRAQATTTRKVALKVEIARAAEGENPDNYPVGHKEDLSPSPDDQWSSYETSDPVEKVKAAMRTIASKVGMDPTVMHINGLVLDTLLAHPGLKELIKYSQKGIMTLELLKEIFGIANIAVTKTMYYPKGSATKRPVWGNHCILAYSYQGESNVDMGVADLEPSFGYTFRLNDTELGKMPIVFSYKPGNGKVTKFNTTDIVLPKIVMPSAGYIIENVLGS